VVALYGWLAQRGDRLLTWRRSRPVRRCLRARNVVTMLSVAGLVLTAAALLVLIGLGQAQIAASQGTPPELFGRPLFDLGGLAFVTGIILAGIAISANGSQGTARREFPDLLIRAVAVGGPVEVTEPGAAPYGGGQVCIQYARLHIFNRELDRTAVLSPTLLWPVVQTEETREWAITAFGLSPARWVPQTFEGLPSINALALPLHVEPRCAVEGDVFFELSLDQRSRLDPNQAPRIILSDEVSGRWFQISTSTGNDQGPRVT